ncbi:DUF262 domain-containing protein [Halarcobacter sp.]|uniref:DUF262 domain-containing protein n=1 Tax=Halarcobacter sp. TaxID=2321133 RepID=UPI003A8EA073
MSYLTGINNIKSIIELNLNLSNKALSGKKFYSIPLNQREFVWDEKVVKQLLSDIQESMLDSTDGFFLGAIVLSLDPLSRVKRNEDIINIDVVDGQQRFTSLTIILSMLYAHALLNKETYSNKYNEDIRKMIEIEDFYSEYINKIEQSLLYRPELSPVKKPILQVSEVFRELYEDIIISYLRNISKQPIEDIYDIFEQKTKTANESSFSRMVKVASASKDFIINELNDFDDLKKFVEFLLDKVQIVVTATETLNSAFNVFESLNGRGIGLLPEDLIKNYIFKSTQSNTNYKTHVDIWTDFIKNLKKDDSEKYQFTPFSFFDLYFLSNGAVVSKNDVFNYFTRASFIKINTDEEINSFLNRIKDLSKFLSEQYKLQHSLNRIGFGLGFSTILALYKHRTDSNYTKYIEQIARLGFVLLVSKDKGIKEKVKNLNITINKYSKNESDKTLYETIKEHIDNALDNELESDFVSKLKILKVGRTGDGNNKAKYLLSIISEKLDGSSYDISLSTTQIEHLLPITRNSKCNEEYTDVEYSAYKSKLGNVTIMGQVPNHWNSNDCFVEKVKKIKESQRNEIITSSIYQEIPLENCAPSFKKYREYFNYGREDFNSKLWTKLDIERRTESLVNIAKYIWIDGNL